MKSKKAPDLSAIFLGGLLSVAVFTAQASTLQDIGFSPSQVLANQDFNLTLTGASTLCLPVFSHQAVSVSTGRIDLTVMAADNPAADCVSNPLPTPYKTDFAISALKPGRYEVYAALQPPCMYENPRCLIATVPSLAGVLVVSDSVISDYDFQPQRAASGQGFSLQLTHPSFTCASSFSDVSVSVSGRSVNIAFSVTNNPAIRCGIPTTPIGPTYTMPALEPGSYQVMVQPSYPCPAVCIQSLPLLEWAGNLEIVADSGGIVKREGWYLESPAVLAGAAFRLQLLNSSYGNCQTRFSHLAVTKPSIVVQSQESAGNPSVIDGQSLRFSFITETDSAIVCIQNLTPYGPAFDMEPLTVGLYPIYVTELPACMAANPPCVLKMPLPSVVSDTLVVMQTLALPLKRLRMEAPLSEWKASSVSVTLPGSAVGAWNLESITLTGKILARSVEKAQGGTRIEFKMGRNPPHGFSLLKLTGPDGSRNLIPILGKE